MEMVVLVEKMEMVDLVELLELMEMVEMYTYQLLLLRHESYTCESKALISHQIMPADQLLTPDSQM